MFKKSLDSGRMGLVMAIALLLALLSALWLVAWHPRIATAASPVCADYPWGPDTGSAPALTRAAHPLSAEGLCRGDWVFEEVDAREYAGVNISLAVDEAGNPSIAYWALQDEELMYAFRDVSGWHTEYVAEMPPWSQAISLKLDGAGDPHLCYGYGEGGQTIYDLRYAYKDGMGWHDELVDGEGQVGLDCSLDLDADDFPHVAYAKGYGDYNLKYAHQDQTGWHVEIIRAGVEVRWISMSLDPSGYAHVAYYKSNDGLWHTYRDANGWHHEQVGTSSTSGHYNSLIVDQDGYPHISFRRKFPTYDLVYAHKDSEGWHQEPLAEVGNLEGTTSLALDPTGRPSIAYCPFGAGLSYASRDSSEWRFETLVAGDFVGAYNSLALDGYGNPQIGYSGLNVELLHAAIEYIVAVDDVSIAGPTMVQPNQTVVYTANYLPATATLPVTLTWSNEAIGSSATYSWAVAGAYTVAVTATNRCPVTVVDRYGVQVLDTHGPIYLPMVLR